MTIKYVHTNIVSRDSDNLAKFYIDVLGCELVPPKRDLKGAWLDKGIGIKDAHLKGMHLRLPGYGKEGPTLEIYEYGHMEENLEPLANRKGYGHLAFHVDNVSSMREKVLHHGGKDLGQITETEVSGVGKITFIYMKDPEGNILELQKWS